MLLSLLLLHPVAQADRGWFARTFGPADDDGDGVLDRDDNCPTFPEIQNGYADDDGCPDYLSFVTVQATHGGRRLPFAEYWMRHDGHDYVANGPAMSLENLVPGARVEVAARHACLGAEGTVRAGTDPVGLRLELDPERDTEVAVHIHDEDGNPLEANLTWTGSSPAACGPLTARETVDGSATFQLGVGRHAWVVRSRGRAAEGVLEIEEPIPSVELDVVLEKRRTDAMRKLEPTVYFASGSARLDPRATESVELLVATLQERPELSITLEGHADTRASSLYNDELAMRRAQSVRDALVAAGIDTHRIQTTGQGEREPAEPGYTEAAHARNRRVEVLVRGRR